MARNLLTGLAGLAALVAGLATQVWAAGTPLEPPLARWLAAHPQARFAPEADYGPMVFVEADGQAKGLSVDLLNKVARHAGLRLQALPAAPLHRLMDMARRREVDLLTSLRPTPERADFLLFTRPYVEVPAVLVQRASAPAAASPAELTGRRVAVGRGYAVEAVMQRRHPQVQWQSVDDDTKALRGVLAGEFDAAVADAASVAFIVGRERLSGLRAGAQVGFNYELCFAVRKDWPELRDILDASIRTLDPREVREVLLRWLPAQDPALAPDKAPWATRLVLGLLGLAMLAFFGALWHRWRHLLRRPPPAP